MPGKLDLTGKMYKINGQDYQVIKQGKSKLGGAGDLKTTWICQNLTTGKKEVFFTKNIRRSKPLSV